MTKTASDATGASFTEKLGESLKSIIKVALHSRCCTIPPTGKGRRLIILGNGPSLNETIAVHGDLLRSTDTIAVNFAANTPQFVDLRPRYYLLADPHFYQHTDDPNVSRLLSNLSKVDWPMILFLPATAKKSGLAIKNPNVSTRYYNAVGAEGFRPLTHFLYRRGLAMPRPRNVLIPSIMVAIKMGYREIFITGADHSWMQTLSVDDNNNVVSIQPHFYKEDQREEKRVTAEYRGYRLHDIIRSFYTAFRAYHMIEDFARSENIEIYNATPGSFIDAFRRKQL